MSKEAIEHYEAALKEAFPSGATGDVFHHWNEARKELAEQPAPVQQCMEHGECFGGECIYPDTQPAQQQEPVAIALNTGTKQGVKWLKNVEHGEHLYTSPPAQPQQEPDEVQMRVGNSYWAKVDRKTPAEQPAPMIRGDIRDGLVDDEPAHQHIEHCLWARNGNQPCPHVQPAQQQEPVGRLESDPYEGHVFVPRIDGDWSMLGADLYTSPPAQRTWVGLTDEQWQSIADTLGCFITRGQKDAIEAKLRERNT